MSLSSRAANPSEAATTDLSSKSKRYLLALGIALIVALGLVLSGLGVFNQAASSSTTTGFATTSYVIAAPTIASDAANSPPPGYSAGAVTLLHTKESGVETAAYALFSDSSGADVNMTVLVFASQATAQSYVNDYIKNINGLSGYTNDNSSLSSYQRYGTCYAYGQVDPGGAGVIATGACTKGNVFIQVHIASTESLPAAQLDVAAFVGSAYSSVD